MGALQGFINYIAVGFKPSGGGEIFQWIILFTLLTGLGFVVERAIYLFRAAGNPSKFMGSLQQFIKTENWDGALKFSDANSKMPLARAISAIIRNRDAGSKKVQKAIDEVFLADAPKITKNLPMISTIANAATMFGLMGTIFGLMMSFDAVANAPAAQRATELAKGISVAMSTTLFGLLAAIPLVLLQGALSAKADNILSDLDEKTTKLVNLIEA